MDIGELVVVLLRASRAGAAAACRAPGSMGPPPTATPHPQGTGPMAMHGRDSCLVCTQRMLYSGLLSDSVVYIFM